MFKSTSTSLILLGILAVIVGIIAIAWPSATILALVIFVRGLRVHGRRAVSVTGCRPRGPSAAGPPGQS